MTTDTIQVNSLRIPNALSHSDSLWRQNKQKIRIFYKDFIYQISAKLLFSKQTTWKYFSKPFLREKNSTKKTPSFFAFYKSKRKYLDFAAWDNYRSWSLLCFQVFTPLIWCFMSGAFRNFFLFFLIEMQSIISCTLNRIKGSIIPSCLAG